MIRRVLNKARRLLTVPMHAAAPRSDAGLEARLRLVDEDGHPNINPLWAVTKDLEAVRLNVKMLGYALASALEPRLQAVMPEPQLGYVLDSKACTQADIEGRWFRYWCEQLRERPRFHRRLWEYAYVGQALNAADVLRPGARVLGLGVSNQPIPSYLVRAGAQVVLAHDPHLPVPAKGGHDPHYDDRFTDPPSFMRQLDHRSADLDALPVDLNGFDALWSIEAAGRRGSIDKGLDLVRNAMATLKPGGVAVHVVDFNFADDERTIDNWTPVLFQRRHIEALAAALKADGHEVSPLDFNVGFQEMDRFIDFAPFDTARTPAFDRLWRDGWQGAHLKVMVDGFAVTSFGLVVRKARA